MPRSLWRRYRAARRAAGAVVLGAAGLTLGLTSCEGSSVPSPFGVRDAGSDAFVIEGGPPDTPDAAPDRDDTLGGPCVDDGQCDDAVACTFDHCDTALGRCRFQPDDTLCVDDVYCDGIERCVPGSGCTEGPPVTCSDRQPCTIDSCVEADESCRHESRDADQDGDPVWNCSGGGDCNDTNPLVGSQADEVCGNGVDDDCDLEVDETGCTAPEHDTCSDALEVSASGRYALSLSAAASDYAASCAGSGAMWRDVVAAIIVPEGPAIDVDIRASAGSGLLRLATAAECGSVDTEIACAEGVTAASGGTTARLVLRAPAAGAYPLYVFASQPGEVRLDVEYRASAAKPVNETCGTAAAIVPDEHRAVSIADASLDLSTACDAQTGELVYSFSLAELSDVRVFAASTDGWGEPVLSLRGADCAELTCRAGSLSPLYVPRLPAGDYFLAVAATAPTELDVVLEVEPASDQNSDETCATAPALTIGQPVNVVLATHGDDIPVGCAVGAPDAAYALELPETSDVLLVARVAETDQGALSLVRPPCAGSSDVIACENSLPSPLRVAARNVPAGELRAVVETQNATSARLTAFTRPAAPASVVPFADDCATATIIPEGGGLFLGNTSNAAPDYDAGCDFGAQMPGGAPDQMLKLTLTERRRVVLDMNGSGYQTLLDVRRGPTCPGTEVTNACAAGYVPGRSFLELVLDPDVYYIQVDGYSGSAGPWLLNVFTAPAD
jgi:hypothetical protein